MFSLVVLLQGLDCLVMALGVSLPRPAALLRLPAGTHVKHGTTSDVLRSALERGLRAQGGATVARFDDDDDDDEVAELEGIHVGRTYSAYGAAVIRFRNNINAAYAGLLQGSEPLKPSVPVVLNIVLREDCTLILDEVYDRSTPRVEDAVWAARGSGALVRAGGIPAEWIESVESPCLLGPHALRAARDFMARVTSESLERALADEVRDKWGGSDEDARDELLALLDDSTRLGCASHLMPRRGACVSDLERDEFAWDNILKDSERLVYQHPHLSLQLAGQDPKLLQEFQTSLTHTFMNTRAGDGSDRIERLLRYFEQNDGDDGATLANFFWTLTNYVSNQVRIAQRPHAV